MKKKRKSTEHVADHDLVPICDRIQKLEEHMKEIDEVWVCIGRYEDDFPNLSSAFDSLKKKLAAQGIHTA
jgi:hypothetical protein